MNLKKQEQHGAAIPDLRHIPMDRLDEMGGSALKQSIMLYRRRMNEASVPLSSFNSSIR